MKLVHPELGNALIFEENIINVVTIENKPFFVKIVQSLMLQCSGEDGEFILSNENKELDISKLCTVIVDPFNFNINGKHILNKVYTQLKTLAVNEDHYLETNKLKTNLYSYFDSLLFDCDIPLVYQDDFDIVMLFKMMDIHIDPTGTKLIDRLIDYIAIMTDILNIECFFFVNLKQFLSYEELSSLYQFIQYAKVAVVLFEGSFTENKHNCEKHYIIDTDLCEIY